MPKKAPHTTGEKLDEILTHLRNLDRRDRWRTIGGFFRNLIHMIPIVLILITAWYLYKNGDLVLDEITRRAAEQATRVTQESLLNVQDLFVPEVNN